MRVRRYCAAPDVPAVGGVTPTTTVGPDGVSVGHLWLILLQPLLRLFLTRVLPESRGKDAGAGIFPGPIRMLWIFLCWFFASVFLYFRIPDGAAFTPLARRGLERDPGPGFRCGKT